MVSGARFGHDGMIRVCNLCLSKLSQADSDDEDDRMSTTSSFPGHFSIPSFFGNTSSPFASSMMGKREDPTGGLYSINETRSRVGSLYEESGFNNYSRPMTPTTWDTTTSYEPAPFRRTLSAEEEARDALMLLDESEPFAPDASPTQTGTGFNHTIDFPQTIPIHSNGQGGEAPSNSIAFPLGSPEKQLHANGEDSPYPGMRSRFNSYDVPTPFIRSRVHSRMEIDRTPLAGDMGWRTRRESTA